MSAAAMSVGDFIRESELFPYSKENYELVKEASEINLMSQYIDSQRFYLENVDLAGSDKNLPEGFLLESAAEDQIQLLEEKMSEKVGGFMEKAKKFFGDLIDKFINFLTRLLDGCNKLDKKSDEVAKMAADIAAFSPEKKKTVADAIEAAQKSCGLTFAKGKGKNDGNRFGFKFADPNLAPAIGSVIKERVITVVPGEKCAGALGLGEVSRFFGSDDGSGRGGPNGGLAVLGSNFAANIASCQKDNCNPKKGLAIDFRADGINKTLNSLKGYRKSLDTVQKSGVDPNGDFKDNFAAAREAIAHTMSLFSSAHRFRSLVVNKLHTAASTKETEPKADTAPKEKAKEEAPAAEDGKKAAAAVKA